jgi:hypothetical protein
MECKEGRVFGSFKDPTTYVVLERLSAVRVFHGIDAEKFFIILQKWLISRAFK